MALATYTGTQTETYSQASVTPETVSHILSRIDALRNENSPYNDDRWRIRQIMNGGKDGIRAIMAWDKGKGSSGKAPDLGSDLPAVNMMASGVERLAQKVGVPPTLRMPVPRDSDVARKAAEKRERIVEGWDALSRTNLMFPQVGRWLPGYAFTTWMIRPKRDPVTNQLWPHVELRDPYDTWPGYYGPGQQPVEVAYRRAVPKEALSYIYPMYDWDAIFKHRRGPGGGYSSERSVLTNPVGDGTRNWEGPNNGTIVVEYVCGEGTFICCPEFEMVVDYTPNICDTGPMFVAAKRYSFDKLVSAYHHVIGLVAMMAKMNVLSLVASEESAFGETNVFGEMTSNTYQRGRRGFNEFEANARVERPRGDQNYQIWQQIDRLERQLRIGAAYDQGSDSMAARGGFITGQGQRELRDPIESNIAEYQVVIKSAMEEIDTRRLEWEERHERLRTKRVFWLEGSKNDGETYVPSKDIAGNWRSRREYGMMATWDDNAKIVAGLQLLQADIIDTVTMQENLSGIDNVPQVNQRIMQDRTRRGLIAALEMRAGQGDPAALMAMIEIHDKPDQVVSILKKFFTPAEPEMTPEEAAMAAAGGMPGAPPGMPPGGGEIGPPPTVQTVLAQLEGSGAAKGGVQTIESTRRPG